MSKTRKTYRLSGLSLLLVGLGAQAQDEPTMVILPDAAADQASIVTQDIVLPDEAADGMATAEANRGAAQSEANRGAAAALDALAAAQANAADAADDGLRTAMEAVEDARENLGRANMPDDLPDQVPEGLPDQVPDGLPDQVPEDLPAVPEGTVPEGTDLPTPPAPPAPPIGG